MIFQLRFTIPIIIVLSGVSLPLSTACPHLRKLQGMSNGHGNGHGGGGGAGGSMAYIQELLDNHELVSRNVVHNSDGSITATTYSDDDTVAGWLQAHVAEMKAKTDNFQYMRSWDPFFVALVDNHEETEVAITNLNNGIQVDLSATTECGQALIEAHTAVVSLFVETGREEASKAHPVPTECSDDWNPGAEDSLGGTIKEKDNSDETLSEDSNSTPGEGHSSGGRMEEEDASDHTSKEYFNSTFVKGSDISKRTAENDVSGSVSSILTSGALLASTLSLLLCGSI